MTPMWELIAEAWPLWSMLCVLLLSVIASGHAILHKRSVHASASWAALIWLLPVLGAVAYVLLGLNRIRRRASSLRAGAPRIEANHMVQPLLPEDTQHAAGVQAPQLAELSRLLGEATGAPLLPGNRVAHLQNGDEAYPAMLAAIDSAEHAIGLATYIFERRGPGERFVEALGRAVARGVDVRVLLDDVGALYGLSPVDHALRRRGVTVARFLPLHRAPYFNLRNHRKLLLVDGRVAFTGGLNIRPGHVLGDDPRNPIRDLHFRLEGPVVGQLSAIFAEDWAFVTGKALEEPHWWPALQELGQAPARAIPDGPDEDMDKVLWAFLGAIACARQSIRIMTPYFLPELSITTAFHVAAMRGVNIDIVLPERGNLPVVQWAMWGHLRQVLSKRCHIWLTPGIFDHSKLMVIDELWTIFGSPNWDPRSLRLNFELAVECYDAKLAHQLTEHVKGRLAMAREVTLHELQHRPLPLRVRDGIARLLTPYL